MKKIFALLLVVIFVLSMTACGAKTNKENANSTHTAPEVVAPSIDETDATAPDETESETEDESVQSLLDVFEAKDGLPDENSPIWDLYFIKNYKSVFDEDELYVYPAAGKFNIGDYVMKDMIHEQYINMPWSALKDVALSETVGLSIFNPAGLDGINIMSGYPFETDASIKWSEAVESGIVDMSFGVRTDSEGAASLFGSDVNTNPIETIFNKLGSPTVAESLDDDSTLGVTLIYELNDRSLIVTIIPQDDNVYMVSMVYTSST